MFDPENIVKLAVEGGCNAVASTLGVLGAVSRKYAHKIPFLLKFNHNEFLTYPNKFDQIFFARVKQARDMGAVAVGATIYFGSAESSRQIVEVSQAFEIAHEMGLATVLWCYLRNNAFQDGQGLPRVRRPHRPGQPSGRDHRGGHHQAEAAGEQRRVQRAQHEGEPVRQDRPARVHAAHHRPSHRPHPLPGGQLLHGTRRPDQFRRRFGRERLPRGGAHRGHQQARGRHGPDLRPQGVPAADGRRA